MADDWLEENLLNEWPACEKVTESDATKNTCVQEQYEHSTYVPYTTGPFSNPSQLYIPRNDMVQQQFVNPSGYIGKESFEVQQQFMPPPPLIVSPPPPPIPQHLRHPPPSVVWENPRDARNKAEKQRRDKLNHSISELATMVPLIVSATRKIDKTSVLRLTATYLRRYLYVFSDSISNKPDIKPETVMTFLKMMNGVLLTTTYKGIVVVVSPNIQDLLGYSEIDLLGHNLLNITHEDDKHILREQLMPRCNVLGPNGELIIPNTPDGPELIAKLLAQEKRSFQIRLKKYTTKSEPTLWVQCHIEGSLRRSDRASSGYSRSCQVMRRARTRADEPFNSSGNDIVFIGIMRIVKDTFRADSQLEAYRLEYRTRHTIDGEIMHCDQRISLVAGYMTDEVAGVNAMNFMHRDDVRWVVIALRQMYDNQRTYGESCYRLITRNGKFIFMRTRGCLEIDRESKAAKSFLCTNTLVSESEGRHLIGLMKKKFSILVNNSCQHNFEPTDEDDQRPAIEDPVQIERVIMHLVTNLPSYQGGNSSNKEGQLSIIAPDEEKIKNAIAKSLYIINKKLKITIRKRKRSEKNDASSDDGCCSESSDESRTSVVHVPGSSSDITLFNLDNDSKGNEKYTNGHEIAKQNMSKLGSFEDIFMNSEVFNQVKPIDYNYPATISKENTVKDQVLTNAAINVTRSTNSFYLVSQSTSSTLSSCTPSIVTGLKRSKDVDPDEYASKRKVLNKFNDLATRDSYKDLNDILSPNIGNLVDYGPEEIQEEGFEDFIDALIDPSADLCDVVPGSLTILESSISQLDNTVNVNVLAEDCERPEGAEVSEIFSDIMLEQEESRNLIDSMQNNPKNSSG